MIQVLVNNVVVAEITPDGAMHGGNDDMAKLWAQVFYEVHYDIRDAGEGTTDFIEQREFDKSTEALYAARFKEVSGYDFKIINVLEEEA